jgi:hypothetical protein
VEVDTVLILDDEKQQVAFFLKEPYSSELGLLHEVVTEGSLCVSDFIDHIRVTKIRNTQ